MSVNAIFAVDYSGGLGYQGSLPWPHDPEDMKFFKNLTTGHVVIMGRNTWDDPKMPKPLPNRTNVVFTNRPIRKKDVICISGEYGEEIQRLQEQFPTQELFIIGGKELIEKTKALVDKIYLTKFIGKYKVDLRINLNKYLDGFELVGYTAGTNCNFFIYKPEDQEFEDLSEST